jgi:quercetin dioxygenase-like cupin family protein
MTLVRRLLVALSVLAVPFEGAAAQDIPPGPTTRHRMTYEVANPPQGSTDVVQLVLDFAPGAFTPPHMHPGPTFVTVLEGTMTRHVEGTQETFEAGQGWVEPGRVHAAGNSSDVSARVLVTAMIPEGAPLTTIAASGATGQVPPGPRTVAMSRRPFATLPSAPYDLHHYVLDFAPAAISPAHTHGGPTYVTVLSGLLQRRAEGVEETFWPGQTWEEPGVPHAAANRAQSPASVGVAYLVPKGQTVTHVVEEPRASDGLGLSSEAWTTRASFAAVWGERAATRWVEERNAALAAPEPDATQ